MMKILCVAVFVLSLTSVCRPASLACDKLLNPVDKSPNLTGRWYLIAMSSDICLIPAFFNAFLWPSIVMDIAAQATPKVYDANFKFNTYGYCAGESESILLEHNIIHDVDSNNLPTGQPDVLLQTGCPDCLVIKGDDAINTFLLFSRRKTVTAAELKEFETQADCLGWSKPQILNTDHEYENCKSFDDDDVDTSALSNMMYQRLKSSYKVPLQCITESVLYYPRAAYDWASKQWSSYWT